MCNPGYQVEDLDNGVLESEVIEINEDGAVINIGDNLVSPKFCENSLFNFGAEVLFFFLCSINY